MKTKLVSVPDSLLYAIIIHVLIGWGFLYLVKTATVHLSHNAFLGLIPATIIIFAFIWLIYDLACIFPNQGISIIFTLVFGKLVGRIIGIIFILYIFFFTTIMLRDAQLMVYTYFFTRTPFIIFTAVVLTAKLYIALKGIVTIGRLAAFMLIIPLFLLLLLILIGLSNVNPINVQPVLNVSPLKWLQAGSGLTLVLLPETAIVFYLSFIKQPKTIKKIGLISLGIVVPIFFLSLFGTIGVFGSAAIHKMNWPVVEFFHILDYPYLLLEQAGLFFLIAWYPFHFIGISQALFVIGNELHSLFSQIKRNWFILTITILIFIGANLPIDVVFLQVFLRRFQSLIPLSFLGILLITWLVARWRFST